MSDGGTGSFTYGDGRKMIVNIKSRGRGGGGHEVSFHPSDRDGPDMFAADDSGGNSISIFQTVIAMVEEWYSRNKDDVKFLFAEPSTNDKYQGKRQRLYLKLAERMAKKYGGTVTTDPAHIYWYPDNSDDLDSDVYDMVSELLQSEQFFDDLENEGEVEKSIGDDIDLTFVLSNLSRNNNIIELDRNHSQPPDHYEFNVDVDNYIEFVDGGTVDDVISKDLKTIKTLLTTMQ
jgi:hypothetical protein